MKIATSFPLFCEQNPCKIITNQTFMVSLTNRLLMQSRAQISAIICALCKVPSRASLKGHRPKLLHSHPKNLSQFHIPQEVKRGSLISVPAAPYVIFSSPPLTHTPLRRHTHIFRWGVFINCLGWRLVAAQAVHVPAVLADTLYEGMYIAMAGWPAFAFSSSSKGKQQRCC